MSRFIQNCNIQKKLEIIIDTLDDIQSQYSKAKINRNALINQLDLLKQSKQELLSSRPSKLYLIFLFKSKRVVLWKRMFHEIVDNILQCIEELRNINFSIFEFENEFEEKKNILEAKLVLDKKEAEDRLVKYQYAVT